jgi:hypothetical protein
MLALFCGVQKESSVLHFKQYNLAIYVVKFFEKISIYYFNTKKQDSSIESQQKKKKIQFMQFALEVVFLECFLGLYIKIIKLLYKNSRLLSSKLVRKKPSNNNT